MKTTSIWIAASLALVGCSGDDGGGTGDTTGVAAPGQPPGVPASNPPAPAAPVGQPVAVPGTAGTGGQPNTPVGVPIPPAGVPEPAPTSGECDVAGLELEGLMYSPGGTLLPHPCEPFDPTTNNPYAVRCVDAWPWYDTGYPGDEYCILPPEPSKGIQIGVHPQGTDWYEQVSQGDLSGYENPESGFILGPGLEEERNYKTSSSNTDSINFYRTYVRMRAGSHHMIVSAAAPESGDGRETWVGGSSTAGLFGGVSMPGAQRPDENVPKTIDKPPEDEGLYTAIGPDRTVTFNMHHFNPTDANNLKEAWENLWFEDDASVRVIPIFGLNFSQVAGAFAQPGETVDMHYRYDIGSDIRVVQLFGHRHVWTSNFSVWVDRASGEQEVLYQSFDWFDQPTYRYDSLTENPVPMPAQLQDGGASGVQMLESGDKLHFNCHIAFTDERAAAEEAPAPSTVGTLRFANQAYDAEMCILFGSTTGSFLGSPTRDTSPVPDFASAD